MPYQLGAECWMNLFNLTQLYGIIRNEALEHDNVDKDAIRDLGYDLLHLHDEGKCDMAVLNRCVEEASRAVTALGEVFLDEEGPDDIDAMVQGIGEGLMYFLSCMVDTAAVGVQIIQEQPFAGWPEDEQGWLQIVEPNRHHFAR